MGFLTSLPDIPQAAFACGTSHLTGTISGFNFCADTLKNRCIATCLQLVFYILAAVEKTVTEQIVWTWTSLETGDHTHITGTQERSLLAEVHDIAIRILTQPEILPWRDTSRS
jgi:hypothetical protein